MTSGSRRRAVSSIPRTALDPWWCWRRGLQSRREVDAWQGYDNNTAHPPDANSRQGGAFDITASRQIYDAGSDGQWEI